MIEGMVVGGIVVAMYFIVYKYEELSKSYDGKNEHYNHLEKMWVAFPGHKSLVK